MIQVNWDEKDKSIIRLEISGEWTWEEYHDGTHKIAELMNTVDYRVDVIMEMGDAGPLPMSAASLHLHSGLERTPENHGVTVIVEADKLTRMVIESLDRVLPAARDHFFFAGSVSAARRVILVQRGASFSSGLDSETRPIIPRS